MVQSLVAIEVVRTISLVRRFIGPGTATPMAAISLDCSR